jgi:hypothetical protein
MFRDHCESYFKLIVKLKTYLIEVFGFFYYLYNDKNLLILENCVSKVDNSLIMVDKFEITVDILVKAVDISAKTVDKSVRGKNWKLMKVGYLCVINRFWVFIDQSLRFINRFA